MPSVQGPVGPDDTAQPLVSTRTVEVLADQATDAMPRREYGPAAAKP